MKLDTTTSNSVCDRVWLACVTIAWTVFESLWFFQIAIAICCRGPLWNFYWPWEERVPKIQPLNSIDLSEFFWIQLLGGARPQDRLVREMPGIILIVTHLVVVPLLVCIAARRCRRQVPIWRTFLLFLVVQVLVGIAGKILLRNMLNWKYFVSFPEQMLNI